MLQEKIYDKPDLRLTVEGILYRMRIGCPWRDLPGGFGHWNSVYKRFNAWSIKGKWLKIFNTLVDELDLEWGFIDGSYVKAHQHSTGACGDDPQAIGKSRAGNTGKIHLVVDAYGLPIKFDIMGGQINDCTAAPYLIEQLPMLGATVADKSYDNQALRRLIGEKGSIVVIPRKCNLVVGNEKMDWGLYKYRHVVENTFARLKHFRAIATRYDKLKKNYESMVAMACAYLWIPM